LTSVLMLGNSLPIKGMCILCCVLADTAIVVEQESGFIKESRILLL
jgi:hypothetical protein